MIGLGSLGVLFTHAARSLGAARVTGVDLVDRSDVAAASGIDTTVWRHSRDRAQGLDPADAPDVVVEAVGHQQGTIADALQPSGRAERSTRSGCPTTGPTPCPTRRSP